MAFSAPNFELRVPGAVFLRGEGDGADRRDRVERISASNFMAFLGSRRRWEVEVWGSDRVKKRDVGIQIFGGGGGLLQRGGPQMKPLWQFKGDGDGETPMVGCFPN